jgi:hypothetical protein
MSSSIIDSIIDEILAKIPKPNYDEMPDLYHTLDGMARRIVESLIKHGLLEQGNLLVRFDKADESIIKELILENPDTMIPFFVMICGFSERELERLYGIRSVYGLGEHAERRAAELTKAIKKYLKYPYHLETVIYKFYKNWEEHQKRHFRGRRAEELVRRVLVEHGYDAGKTRVVCGGEEIEVDCAIPRSGNMQVAIMVRHGVFRDLVKRAKEFSTEFDGLMKCYPGVRFVVVYLVSQHEKGRINEIRKRIEAEREGKRPYDLIILTEDELRELLPRKLEEWGVPRAHSFLLDAFAEHAGS